MSVGWVTPNKPGLLGFLEGKRLGAVNAQGTSAHFLPGSFPGQKACRLFGFRFSMNRRGSYGIFHYGLSGLERWEWRPAARRGGSGRLARSPMALLCVTAFCTYLTLLIWGQQGVGKQVSNVKFCPALGEGESKGRLAVSPPHE